MARLDPDDLLIIRLIVREEVQRLRGLTSRKLLRVPGEPPFLQGRFEVDATEVRLALMPHLAQRAGEMAVASLLRRLGWTKARAVRAGVRVWIWRRPAAASSLSPSPTQPPPEEGAGADGTDADGADDSVPPPRPRRGHQERLPTMDEFFTSLREKATRRPD